MSPPIVDAIVNPPTKENNSVRNKKDKIDKSAPKNLSALMLGIQKRALTKQHLEVTREGVMKTIYSNLAHTLGGE